MRLLNYTTSYFAAILLLVISIWAAIFYYSMLDEIYDSIDDGLDNQKQLIIRKALADTAFLNKQEFGEGTYKIRAISKGQASKLHDIYSDTLMYMENEDEYEPVRLLKTIFISEDRYYELQVITSMVEEDDLVNALLYALIWLYLGIVLPVVLLNNILLKKVWKPFYRLVSQLKDFRVDKLVSISTQRTKIEEFRLLNEALQKMQNNNLEVYSSQKHFIENAAHELQTPLAVAINRLEHLAEGTELSNEQLRLLSSALDSLDRLTRLNRSLLLLSKIENHQYDDRAVVNIKQVAEKIIEDFDDQIAYRKLNISRDIEDCIVEMNHDLAIILITNLIKNAVVHAPPQSTIRILIQQCFLTVENGGDTPLDANSIFSRFNTQSQSSQSTGLGLSIVKAIADLYGFTAAYSYQGLHRITITFL